MWVGTFPSQRKTSRHSCVHCFKSAFKVGCEPQPKPCNITRGFVSEWNSLASDQLSHLIVCMCVSLFTCWGFSHKEAAVWVSPTSVVLIFSGWYFILCNVYTPHPNAKANCWENWNLLLRMVGEADCRPPTLLLRQPCSQTVHCGDKYTTWLSCGHTHTHKRSQECLYYKPVGARVDALMWS